jgi:dTMP kinase
VFVTFEGIDGSGKTTQVRLLENALKRKNIPVLTTREPGGTAMGSVIRSLMLDTGPDEPVVSAETFLVLADRAQHVEKVILPALKAGVWVISDRFADALPAYQGFGRGLELPLLGRMNALATGGLKPRLTFLLDCGEQTAVRRIRERIRSLDGTRGGRRFDLESPAFFRRVREGYLALSASDTENRFRVLDAERSPEELHRRILEIIEREMSDEWPSSE